jgi:hypothetical protein
MIFEKREDFARKSPGASGSPQAAGPVIRISVAIMREKATMAALLAEAGHVEKPNVNVPIARCAKRAYVCGQMAG